MQLDAQLVYLFMKAEIIVTSCPHYDIVPILLHVYHTSTFCGLATYIFLSMWYITITSHTEIKVQTAQNINVNKHKFERT